ncbi:hypothetical protein D5S17_14120 [Pseudonocardiaceae bacterium YIM PH 21723]|nr:hypothetical protein D5S17_14120 [Pseudonocardiaceae bacterium YIM PH 21723]
MAELLAQYGEDAAPAAGRRRRRRAEDDPEASADTIIERIRRGDTGEYPVVSPTGGYPVVAPPVPPAEAPMRGPDTSRSSMSPVGSSARIPRTERPAPPAAPPSISNLAKLPPLPGAAAAAGATAASAPVQQAPVQPSAPPKPAQSSSRIVPRRGPEPTTQQMPKVESGPRNAQSQQMQQQQPTGPPSLGGPGQRVAKPKPPLRGGEPPAGLSGFRPVAHPDADTWFDEDGPPQQFGDAPSGFRPKPTMPPEEQATAVQGFSALERTEVSGPPPAALVGPPPPKPANAQGLYSKLKPQEPPKALPPKPVPPALATPPAPVEPADADLDEDPRPKTKFAQVPAGLSSARDLKPVKDLDDLDEDELDDELDDLDEDFEERTPGQQWLAMVYQLGAGVIGGAALWLGFQWLWAFNAAVALVLALAVTIGLVLVVRLIRKAEDLQTMVLAVVVGLLVTVSPAALRLLAL